MATTYEFLRADINDPLAITRETPSFESTARSYIKRHIGIADNDTSYDNLIRDIAFATNDMMHRMGIAGHSLLATSWTEQIPAPKGGSDVVMWLPHCEHVSNLTRLDTVSGVNILTQVEIDDGYGHLPVGPYRRSAFQPGWVGGLNAWPDEAAVGVYKTGMLTSANIVQEQLRGHLGHAQIIAYFFWNRQLSVDNSLVSDWPLALQHMLSGLSQDTFGLNWKTWD